MTIDQWVNIGILLTGFASLVLPLHLDNRRKAQAQERRLEHQAVVLDEVLQTLKRHDRRTRKARKLALHVLQQLDNLKRAVSLNNTTRDHPP